LTSTRARSMTWLRLPSNVDIQNLRSGGISYGRRQFRRAKQGQVRDPTARDRQMGRANRSFGAQPPQVERRSNKIQWHDGRSPAGHVHESVTFDVRLGLGLCAHPCKSSLRAWSPERLT
jgi:hypothetical protein